MSCISLHDKFLSYISFNPQQSSQWNAPLFMKSCNEALREVEVLKIKLRQFQTLFARNRLRDKEKQSEMVSSLKENVRICENHLKKLQTMTADMKTTNHKFLQEYKTSVIATLEMKLLEAELKFKRVYQEAKKVQNKNKGVNGVQPTSEETNGPNLNRSHFIDQSHEQIMDEIATSEYKSIQKSISSISMMYKQTASMVRMHEFMIDSIESQVNETEVHVDGGRKQLVEAHRRESGNRGFIVKVFVVLYIVSGVYIVLFS